MAPLRSRFVKLPFAPAANVAAGCTAHEVEARAIEEISKAGQGILTGWAEKSESTTVAKARAQSQASAVPKKNLTWLQPESRQQATAIQSVCVDRKGTLQAGMVSGTAAEDWLPQNHSRKTEIRMDNGHAQRTYFPG